MHEGVFCVHEWLSLRGNDENTKIVTHYYNNAPRAQVHDSSNDYDKTRDCSSLFYRPSLEPKSAPHNPRMMARPTLL